MCERTVALHAEFHVGTVVADHINHRLWQFVTILFIYPTLDRLYYLWIVERVDMIPALTVTAVAAEESLVEQSLKGHTKVVAL